MGAPLCGAGAQHTVIAEFLACGAKQGQQGDAEGGYQPEAVAAGRGAEVDLAHAHAEARILSISEPALDAPAPGVELDEVGGWQLGAAGQAPGLLHVLGLHADDGGNGVAIGGDGGTAQDACAAALADPVGSVPGLAVGGGDRDVAAEADDEVELQLFGQQPVELAVAEAAVGNEADLDPDEQRLGRRTSAWYS